MTPDEFAHRVMRRLQTEGRGWSRDPEDMISRDVRHVVADEYDVVHNPFRNAKTYDPANISFIAAMTDEEAAAIDAAFREWRG